MEEEKKENGMYALAKKYVAMSAAHVKARLLNTHGQAWLDANWTKFNKLRTVVKAKPSKKIKRLVERRENQVRIGMTEERANEVERLVEKIGLGTNTRMGNFICEVKSNIAREHINFQNTAEEIDRLGECVKNLERENDILKQENAQIKARLDALEKLLLE